MGAMLNLLKFFGYLPREKAQPETKAHRNYAGANTGRLFATWTTMPQSADNELRTNLRALRARSRDMAINNDYAKKFLRMVETNVVGKNGIMMQSQVKNERGEADEVARRRIEESWAEWIQRGNCDVTGKYSFRDIQKLVISSVARDGEVLIRKVRGYDNAWGFALQLIEADHLDENYNDVLRNGNRVKMGVEFDQYNKPVAYWIFEHHPGDALFTAQYNDRIRIPADEILHIFLQERISQSRGVPWMHAALTRLQMLGAYEEAELVAARIGAAKMGFITSEKGDEYTGDDTEDGNTVMEVEPGVFEYLPAGMRVDAFDPQHPTIAFDAFVKALLRGIASGLNVSYHYLANDLSEANYSSLRGGEIDVRDAWRDLQSFMIEHFLIDIFKDWLRMALLTNAINLPLAKYKKFSAVKFQPRGWQWVDPEKDIRAREIAIALGLETRADIAAELGKDFDETLQQLAREKMQAEKLGINISGTIKGD
jgi:lambda family phage portal protein